MRLEDIYFHVSQNPNFKQKPEPIETLPLEIFYKILGQLSDKDLHSTAHVNRYWRRVSKVVALTNKYIDKIRTMKEPCQELFVGAYSELCFGGKFILNYSIIHANRDFVLVKNRLTQALIEKDQVDKTNKVADMSFHDVVKYDDCGYYQGVLTKNI